MGSDSSLSAGQSIATPKTTPHRYVSLNEGVGLVTTRLRAPRRSDSDPQASIIARSPRDPALGPGWSGL